MSRDIRAFFKIDNSKKRKSEDINESLQSSKVNKIDDAKLTDVKKRKRRIIDSDDEENEKAQKKTASHKAKEQKKSEKPAAEVKNIKDLFGGPVKRKERPKEAVKTSPTLDSSVVCIDDDDVDELAIVEKIENKLHDNNKSTEKSPVKKSDKAPEIKQPEVVVKNGKKEDTNESNKKETNQPKVSETATKIKNNDNENENDKNKNCKVDTLLKKPMSSASQPATSSFVKSTTEGTVKTTKSTGVLPKSPPKPSAPITVPLLEYSFVDKYKPTSVKQIIGQQGPQSNANKLQNWLLHWHKNHGDPSKKKKANPFAKDSDGSSYKAALLSGPPGIGKTTTAHLVCKELLFDAVEFNASDTRSKRLLKEEVSQLLSNKSLKGYLTGDDKGVSRRHVLIMDEVDGMAGNEDRGGVAELIALIKESQIPIICMCNDRSHPKMRSLVNYCFDLRFNKPSANQIRSAMMSICFKEGIKLENGAIDAIISGTGNDVRQTLNHLALYSTSKDMKINTDKAKRNAQISEKDVKIGPWEVIRKVFSEEEHKKMTLNDKSDLFFFDYNIAPLFVQENYLHVKPNCKDSEVLDRVAKTADSLSLGDTVDRRIRSNMAWSLLPTQAMFSSVMPGEFMKGTFKSTPNFPSWLGKNSKAQKRKRMAQEIHDHTRIVTSGSRSSVRLDYAQFLVQAIIRPLKEKGADGVKEALDVIKTYRLLREDIESLLELTSWGAAKSPWDSIDSKTKAALTRAYNKEVQAYSYSAQAGVKKKKGSVDSEIYGEEEDEGVQESENDDDDDDLEKNSMIKVKKVTAKQEPKASSSKAGSAPKSTAAKSKPKSKK